MFTREDDQKYYIQHSTYENIKDCDDTDFASISTSLLERFTEFCASLRTWKDTEKCRERSWCNLDKSYETVRSDENVTLESNMLYLITFFDSQIIKSDKAHQIIARIKQINVVLHDC